MSEGNAEGRGVEYVELTPGDPAPWFDQRTSGNPHYNFDTVAGRYMVLCFFASAGDPQGRAALKAVADHRSIFDATNLAFFGITVDPADEQKRGIKDALPGLRFFYDFDGKISRLYGAVPRTGRVHVTAIRRFWLVLDAAMRVIVNIPFRDDGSDREELFHLLESVPSPHLHGGLEIPAPVLVLPRVFEPEFSRRLIALYERHGGSESGFMTEVEGKTVGIYDYRHKRRRDFGIRDPGLILETRRRIQCRIYPEIAKAFQFHVTRIERFIVVCYSAEDRGHFAAHRDNTTSGTAHRRFAVSINLNSEFEGGNIRFPEFSHREFKPPIGGAVVFSCSVLHEVSTVTSGRRYAFLPFLHDEAAQRQREEYNKTLRPAATPTESETLQSSDLRATEGAKQ